MKCAVIDIGSNSMRLTVYHAARSSFKILFKEKIMTALAGYIESGRLSDEGIDTACGALMEFKERLRVLGVTDVYVFATASLRNIGNTEEARQKIERFTGFDIEVITGQQEALYGFTGALCDVSVTDGVFADIGGASTEISVFCEGEIKSAESFPIGSLKLYKECVRNIVPGRGSLQRIDERICSELGDRVFFSSSSHGDKVFSGSSPENPVVCIGGTSRAVLKMAHKVFSLPASQNFIRRDELDELCGILFPADKKACDLILKVAPERIHTLIPGMMILRYITHKFSAPQIIVSRYSVREGYLCRKIQPMI